MSLLATRTRRAPFFEPDLLSKFSTARVGVPPHANETFLIRDRKTGLVIALKDGKLGLYPEEKDHGDGFGLGSKPHQHGRGSHWQCVVNEELWLGFKSSMSGQFIGHGGVENDWRFIAKKDHHEWWECFCAKESLDGGNVLLVKYDHGFRAMKAGGREGRELVVAGKKEDGTVWDFIKVE
ncbi:hypothetical protein BJX66DRAFT_344145 [Aspergillus keveii]|uniref:Uncharacterized protein n=1 Tax=Aspergillus keveii TaxID=714993 RepID=A0ABR4FM78_9EURO